MKRLTIGLALAALLLVNGAAAQEKAADEPLKIVETNNGKIKVLVMESKTDDELKDGVRLLMGEFVHFERFGQLCLGKRWKKLTPAQQKLYLAEFKNLLQRTYLRRFKRGRDFSLEFREDTRYSEKKDRAEVKTTIIAKDVTADVDYRFFLEEGAWKAYDIVVDEVSIMRNYRKSFIKVLKKDGFDTLIEKMQKKKDVDEE